MLRNQSIFGIENRISGQLMGNPEFINPSDQNSRGLKQQFCISGKSEMSSQKISFEPNSNNKSNKIKQAKQLLAQRLKEVTKLQFQESERNQNGGFIHQIIENAKYQVKNWDCHMNPISKLTKQPFVRSKTCDELRKQHSLKKMRKRNNSATKYSTPHTNQCQREVRSTGLHSKEVYEGQSAWLQSGKKKVQTGEFVLDPFENNMIETFDEGQIRKLSSEVNNKNFKGKFTSGKKAVPQIRQQQSILSSQIKYPFRINSAFNRTNQESKSPNKFENSRNSNSSSSNLLMNEFNIDSTKFTPRLERYPGFERMQSSQQNINFQKITIRANQQQAQKSQFPKEQEDQENRGNTFEYSDEQSRARDHGEYSPHPSSGIRSGVRSSYNQNELVTNLHLTNTILEEKLRIKEIEIEELNRNYLKLKTELLHAKNMQNQNIRYPQGSSQNLKIQTSSLSNERYLTNLDIENSQLVQHENLSHEFVNESHEISSLPSPKFCDGVEEEFARERYVEPQRKYQNSTLQQREQKPQQSLSMHSKFVKRKQLFSSDMSEKISEEFDSEEIYMPNNYEPEHSNMSKKYVFKKSHFNENKSAKFHQENPKRDSFVYTLGEDQGAESSSKKNIRVSELSASKPISSNSVSQEMLLEPITQSISSESEKIDFLSPIKVHSTQKVENGSFRHSFRTSLTKSQNRVFDDSLRKFDYFLTPQKDESTFIKHEQKQENEGLFEKAFSTLRKRTSIINQPNQQSESHRYSSSSNKKQQAIDPIIEHNIE